MYIGAALTLVSFLSGLGQTDDIRDQIREDQPDLSKEELDAAVTVGITFAIVLGFVFVGLWVWMAIMNGRGRSWARVVATVLGCLNLLITGVGLVGSAAGSTLGQSDTTFNTVASITLLVVAAAVLILLYQPASSAYYDAVTRARMGPRWG